MKENVERVRELLDKPELLCQLAEECNELGKAALKLRRAMTGINPTPLTEAEAWRNITEEAADVMLVLDCLNIPTGDKLTLEIMGYKAQRWVNRLETKNETKRNP